MGKYILKRILLMLRVFLIIISKTISNQSL